MSANFADPEVIRSADAVVLYGAGRVCRDVCRLLTTEGIRVRCMLDRQARTGDSCGDVPIYPIQLCPLDLSERAATPLVVTIFNRETDVALVAHAMIQSGFRQVVSFIDLHALFPTALGNRFWLTGRELLDKESTRIASVEPFWADEKSRSLYRRLLSFRRTGQFHPELSPGPQSVQYLPADVPNWLPCPPVRLVDCGAYQGDTLDLFLHSRVPLQASAHFEPDICSFGALARRAREHAHCVAGPVTLWPCAVGDCTAKVAFQDGQGEASGVTPHGNTTVTAVALDDVLTGWRPTLIKMDIEGAELAALKGARNLIGECRPSLAICLYHRPGDLWEIPELLASWPEMRGYRHHLRAHALMGFDTVLYSIPPDRSQDAAARENERD
jgi:FkbM family methyltransferase